MSYMPIKAKAAAGCTCPYHGRDRRRWRRWGRRRQGRAVPDWSWSWSWTWSWQVELEEEVEVEVEVG